MKCRHCSDSIEEYEDGWMHANDVELWLECRHKAQTWVPLRDMALHTPVGASTGHVKDNKLVTMKATLAAPDPEELPHYIARHWRGV